MGIGGIGYFDLKGLWVSRSAPHIPTLIFKSTPGAINRPLFTGRLTIKRALAWRNESQSFHFSAGNAGKTKTFEEILLLYIVKGKR